MRLLGREPCCEPENTHTHTRAHTHIHACARSVGNPAASQKMGEISAWLKAQGIHVVVERPVAQAEFPKVSMLMQSILA